MKKQLWAFAVCALAAGGAFAQANDTISKVKNSGTITVGVRESSGALSYALGDGKFGGFHVEVCPGDAHGLAVPRRCFEQEAEQGSLGNPRPRRTHGA